MSERGRTRGPGAAGASARRPVAEAVGTCFLLAALVGSGVMGERLAGGNVAVDEMAEWLCVWADGVGSA